MNPDQSIINFNIAQQLKDLGVIQHSKFYYVGTSTINRLVPKDKIEILWSTQPFSHSNNWSAFNIDELSQILIDFIKKRPL